MSYTPGPFATAHVLIQWGGKLPGGEQWSCSIRCAEQEHIAGSTTVPSADSVASWNDGAIKDAVLAFHTRPESHINAAALLSFVKANRIDLDGKYMDPTTSDYTFSDVAGGGGTNNLVPNQVALAVSLLTGYSRGPAHRGRFFLPLPAMALGTDGRFSAALATETAGSVKTFLEALADTPGIDAPNSLTPMVMSRKSGAPAQRKITGAAVGRVLDTQRRRRKSLGEAYGSAVLDLGTY